MTNSPQADKLQIKPLDENATPIAPSTSQPDPRVAAFLDRLKQKASEIEDTTRDNHVTAKEPRRRAIVEQPAYPDWYQPLPAKKAATPATAVKRFGTRGTPGRKPTKPV